MIQSPKSTPKILNNDAIAKDKSIEIEKLRRRNRTNKNFTTTLKPGTGTPDGTQSTFELESFDLAGKWAIPESTDQQWREMGCRRGRLALSELCVGKILLMRSRPDHRRWLG